MLLWRGEQRLQVSIVRSKYTSLSRPHIIHQSFHTRRLRVIDVNFLEYVTNLVRGQKLIYNDVLYRSHTGTRIRLVARGSVFVEFPYRFEVRCVPGQKVTHVLSRDLHSVFFIRSECVKNVMYSINFFIFLGLIFESTNLLFYFV